MVLVANDSSHWRAFDDNEVSHSVAHYLMAIDSLRTSNGYARVTDVAGHLNISRGAASLALSQLKERGLVKEDPNRFLLLTEEGERLARSIEHNFVLLHRFFEDVLGVPAETAREDACKMEHLLSPESSEGLLRFLQALLSKDKLTKALIAEMNGDETICTQSGRCPLCEPVGECLSLTPIDAPAPHETRKRKRSAV